MEQFPYKGYKGRILRVNLSNGKIITQRLPKEYARYFLGGVGLGARLLWNEIGPEIDPLSPDNKLYILTGPLTGTGWPASGRYSIVSRSPLTGIWGESSSGGYFGPEIKFAGYDAIVIEGRASKPVYIRIEDDSVEIRSAEDLWGMDVIETTKTLKERHDPCRVAAIGPAGENLVKFACVINDAARAAGRTGMGAIFGSKNLKAICITGYGSVEVAKPDEFFELAMRAHERVREDENSILFRKYGTPLLVRWKQATGELPTKNHYDGIFPEAEKLYEDVLVKFVVHTRGCYACDIGCKKLYLLNTKYDRILVEGPEYEGIMAFGSNLLISDFGAIAKMHEMCNRLGMDDISAGKVLSFAMEIYEKRIVDREFLDGIDLRWGNPDAAIEMLEKIAYRRGVGNLLAEGVRRAAEKIGKGAERYAMHVKGLEISGQDARAYRSIAITHSTAARGADHLTSLVVVDQPGFEEVAAKRFGRDKLPEIVDMHGEKHKAYAVKVTEEVYALLNSATVCWYQISWPCIFWVEDFAEVLPLVTGEEAFGDPNELMRIGERIVNLKRMINVRFGVTRKDDTLPERFTKEPMPSGPAKGQVAQLDKMLDEYYTLRGWDLETGVPTPQKLRDLGLEFCLESPGKA